MKNIFRFTDMSENKMDFSLNRIKNVLNLYAPNFNELKIIHVAGTNGKGSTSNLISEILFKTSDKKNIGLFSSPHIEKVNERIKINGVDISDVDFRNETEFLENFLSTNNFDLTYFEFLTVLAIKYFIKKNVDIAIFECGLGGRLDATNVFQKPLITVITNIDLEHQILLGNTIEEIFEEKMGIYREEVPMILGITQKSLILLLENKTNFYIMNRDFFIKKNADDNTYYFFNNENQKIFDKIKLKILGDYQYKNLSLVLEIVYLLDKYYKIKFKSFDEVIGVVNSFLLPFRMDLIDYKNNLLNTNLMFDVGHNYPGINATISSIRSIYFRKKIVIFGVLRDKDYKKIFDLIYDTFDFIYLTDPVSDRKLDYNIIYNYATLNFKKEKIKLTTNDINLIIDDINKNFGKDDLVCILGSFYLVRKFTFLKNK